MGCRISTRSCVASPQMVRTLQAEGCPIAEVNTGGGLGVPQRAGDLPLDLGPVGGDPGRAPRPARRGDRHRAGGLPGQGVRDQPGRGGHRGGARRSACSSGLDVGWNAMGERFIYDSLLTWCCAARPTRLRFVTSRSAGTSTRANDLFARGSAVPRRRGGRHRRGAQRGQLQRVHDVGALSATGGHIRVLHGPDLTDMLGDDVRDERRTRADPCRTTDRRRAIERC